MRMPALFVGHGNPMNAIDRNEFFRGWQEVARRLPRPEAILCISAHWETDGTWVTASELPPTIHDFGGFPRALHEYQYPAPGDPALARRQGVYSVIAQGGLILKRGQDLAQVLRVLVRRPRLEAI